MPLVLIETIYAAPGKYTAEHIAFSCSLKAPRIMPQQLHEMLDTDAANKVSWQIGEWNPLTGTLPLGAWYFGSPHFSCKGLFSFHP